jgi:hypothetical protein
MLAVSAPAERSESNDALWRYAMILMGQTIICAQAHICFRALAVDDRLAGKPWYTLIPTEWE